MHYSLIHSSHPTEFDSGICTLGYVISNLWPQRYLWIAVSAAVSSRVMPVLLSVK